jgi:hypothetical protein
MGFYKFMLAFILMHRAHLWGDMDDGGLQERARCISSQALDQKCKFSVSFLFISFLVKRLVFGTSKIPGSKPNLRLQGQASL